MNARSPSLQARGFYLAFLLLAPLLFASAPAVADILVTRDGQEIETDGPWEVKGRQVVFTTKTGVLSAMRLTEVDLEASEKATNWAAPPPPPVRYSEEQPRLGEMSQTDRPEATLTLTNEDVGNASTKELEALARVFGGAMMQVLENAADSLVESGDFSADDKRAFDQEMTEQQRLIQQDYESALLAIASVAKRYPELQELERGNPDSVRRHANALSSAAKELEVAAFQMQTEPARILLNQVATQFQALAASADV